jgi:hypothetical protein
MSIFLLQVLPIALLLVVVIAVALTAFGAGHASGFRSGWIAGTDYERARHEKESR